MFRLAGAVCRLSGRPGDRRRRPARRRLSGDLHLRIYGRPVRLAEITDGTSNTLMFGETVQGRGDRPPRL